MLDTREKNRMCTIGFSLGIISMFLVEIGIIPLVGMLISIIGLIQFKKEKHNNLWMGIVGFILNVLYLIVNANINGNI